MELVLGVVQTFIVLHEYCLFIDTVLLSGSVKPIFDGAVINEVLRRRVECAAPGVHRSFSRSRSLPLITSRRYVQCEMTRNISGVRGVLYK